ncbi:MAG: DUF4123 domain-containing protein [Deltaproteobacteria bacterium]|nr:DUF4123 domain-containing protein [Deltaproteobacteria bacterium]
MRLIVEVISGRRQGHKMLVEPGGRLRIGRTDRADEMLPGDPKLGGAHLELSFDGTSCRVRDLGAAGSAGTLLNGEAVAEAEVRHGDWLRAGETSLLVHYEAASARLARPTAPVKARAIKALRREPGPLYAVLDAAQSHRVLELLRQSPEQVQSLYEGPQAEALADVAPYLVALPRDCWLLDALAHEGWGEAWGIYLVCPTRFAPLRRHLQRFLMVEDEDTGEEMLFRFYDPRVLRVFLPTCSEWQKRELFGEIERFLVEGEDGELVRLVRGGGGEQ